MSALKPCPFCGAKQDWLVMRSVNLPVWTNDRGIFAYNIITCRLCGGSMIDADIDHCMNDLYKAWNTRNKRNANYEE